MFSLFKQQLHSGPIFATLGNHDSVPQAQAGPTTPSGFVNTPSGNLVQQFSWNYDHISKLWGEEGWLDGSVVPSVNAHYGAYNVKWKGGLKIISLNTDYCMRSALSLIHLRLLTRIGSVIGYKPNYYNYIDWASSDPGGMLRFLTDELQAAEDAYERGVLVFLIFVHPGNFTSLGAPVWIIGHVLSGWDGTNPLPNPTNLCRYLQISE